MIYVDIIHFRVYLSDILVLGVPGGMQVQSCGHFSVIIRG